MPSRARHTDQERGGRGRRPTLLFWCDTTAQLPFETGIQRVTRRLGIGLGQRGLHIVPVGWEPQRRLICPLGGARSGRLDAFEALSTADWLIVPEIPMTVLRADLDPVQLAHGYGLCVAAIVHDLIPIRLAHLYAPAQVALYRRYYRMFASADLVLATTQLVAGHLRAHLEDEGLPVPEIVVVPLPAQFADLPRVRAAPPVRVPAEPLRLLTVATWEPRKNLARLLRALRLARENSGASIDLTLVGRRCHDAAHDAEIGTLLAEMPYAKALDWIGDADLAALYDSHHASVYPSCEEGFGMPVLESLWLGRACLCHAGSAMAEVAPGGGALLEDMSNERQIANALVRLAAEAGLLERLTAEALERPLRDWAAYAADVAEQMELPL